MIFISHRGNINGPADGENSPEIVQQAINQGFDVEVDIRYINNEWWLGHDDAEYKINSPLTEFDNSKIWWHCKNFRALEEMQSYDLNYFWHQEDDHTLTSKGYIWTYPGKDQGTANIMVMPELYTDLLDPNLKKFAGICSDYILEFRNNFYEI